MGGVRTGMQIAKQKLPKYHIPSFMKIKRIGEEQFLADLFFCKLQKFILSFKELRLSKLFLID